MFRNIIVIVTVAASYFAAANILSGGTATQSSTYLPFGYTADRLIDGNLFLAAQTDITAILPFPFDW
jgi:hypothetical protein